jgi:hypothetical protein
MRTAFINSLYGEPWLMFQAETGVVTARVSYLQKDENNDFLTLLLAVNTPNRGLAGQNLFDNPRHSIIGNDFPFAA